MVATRLTTIEEFASTPREGLWELIDGEAAEVTPASGRSEWIGGKIAVALLNHVDDHRLGWAFSANTGFILFPDRQTVRCPDASIVLRERLPVLPGGFVSLAPDLAVEVRSPSDRMADARAKVAMYLEAGVRIVWLGDPALRTVTVFLPDSAPRTLGAEDTLDGGAALPDFQLPLAEIFA